MQFHFDINKTLAATTFLLKKEGGKSDIFPLLKMIYWADRDALIHWGKPITGDSAVSMDKGPVPSTIYNLMNGREFSYKEEWGRYITQRDVNSISVRSEFDVDYLSEREKEALGRAWQLVNSMPRWKIADWLHSNCPEWQDPHGSSIPIDYKIILRASGKTDAEIEQIEKDNDAAAYAQFLISES